MATVFEMRNFVGILDINDIQNEKRYYLVKQVTNTTSFESILLRSLYFLCTSSGFHCHIPGDKQGDGHRLLFA